jgi:hypothetical protein
MMLNEYLPNLDVEAPVWLDALERFHRPWQMAYFRPFSNVISIKTSRTTRKKYLQYGRRPSMTSTRDVTASPLYRYLKSVKQWVPFVDITKDISRLVWFWCNNSEWAMPVNNRGCSASKSLMKIPMPRRHEWFTWATNKDGISAAKNEALQKMICGLWKTWWCKIICLPVQPGGILLAAAWLSVISYVTDLPEGTAFFWRKAKPGPWMIR